MGVSTAAGTKLFIGTTASNGVTDTYIEVSEITSIPAFGRVYAEIKHSPLGTRAVEKFKGSYDDGNIALQLGKDASNAGQAAMAAALASDHDYNFKVVANDAVPAVSATVTISIAAPGVVTWTAHGLAVDTAVRLSTTDTLPTGLLEDTTYYVKTVLTENTLTLSATKGGVAITTTATQTGVHTATTVPAPSEQMMKAKVMSYTTEYGSLDSVVGSTATLGIKSGSLVETARLPGAAA